MNTLTKTNSSRIIGGIGWSSLSSILSNILLFSRTFILVRLLVPEDFGVMALSLLLVTTFKQFSFLGLEQAIIQDDDLSRKTTNTIWTVSIFRGVIFFGLINLLAPYYSNFFNEVRLVQVLFVVSFGVLLTGFKNSYVSVMQKELRFDKLFKISAITQLIEFIITIILAILYKDVLALAIGYSVGAFVGLVLSFIVINQRPRFQFDYQEFKKLFHFGKWVLGGGIIGFIILNMDTTVIGKILGASMLGYYSIAFRFANFAPTDIVLTFSQSIYPSFALVKNDLEVLREYFLNSILIITIIILPFFIILGFYAEGFVINFIGQDWSEAILPLKVLVIFGVLRTYLSMCGFVFWSIGKPKIQSTILIVQLIFAATIIYPLTIEYGIIGTAISVTLALISSFVLNYFKIFQELNIKTIHLSSFFGSTLISSILFISVVWLTKQVYGAEVSSSPLNFTLFFAFLYLLNLTTNIVLDFYGNKRFINLVKSILIHLRSKRIEI